MDLARDENIINVKDIRDRSPSRDSLKDGIVLEVSDIKQECKLETFLPLLWCLQDTEPT